jgi:putative transposase
MENIIPSSLPNPPRARQSKLSHTRSPGQRLIQDDEHLLTVPRYIEANPLRAKLVERAGEYRWSSFACHGAGCADLLLDATPAYEALGASAATRQRRWVAYVHQTPDADELSAIRRSSETGLPYGEHSWINRLARRLKLDLTIRPRGRPRTVEVIDKQSCPLLPPSQAGRPACW